MKNRQTFTGEIKIPPLSPSPSLNLHAHPWSVPLPARFMEVGHGGRRAARTTINPPPPPPPPRSTHPLAGSAIFFGPLQPFPYRSPLLSPPSFATPSSSFKDGGGCDVTRLARPGGFFSPIRVARWEETGWDDSDF